MDEWLEWMHEWMVNDYCLWLVVIGGAGLVDVGKETKRWRITLCLSVGGTKYYIFYESLIC